MSFYLARLEAARQQHRMMAAAAAGHSHAPPAWLPYPYQHAGLLPRPHHPPVPPPFHAGRVDTWRGGGVARRHGAALGAGASLGDGARGGVAGSATGATAREETGGVGGGDELRRNTRPLAPTPRPRSPPPKRRRAVSARRLFPPGCGRDAARSLASADHDASRSVAAPRGDGGSGGAPHTSFLPPPALAGGKVDSALFEATSSPGAAASTGAGSISEPEKVSASGGAAGVHHRRGGRLVKSSEASGRNSVAAANAIMDDSQGVAASPSMRLIPKPTAVSANRRLPPGCRRLGAPLPAGDGTANQVVYLSSPEEVVVPTERDDMEFVARPAIDTTLEVQKSQVSSSVTLHEEATACVVEAYASHASSGERIGNRWHCEEQRSSAVHASGANVTNKHGGSSCNVVAAESLAQGLSKERHWRESVPESAALDTTCSDDLAAAVSGEGAVVRKKVMHTPRKSVRPPRLIQKFLLGTQRRPFSKEIDRGTEVGWSVTMNNIEYTGGFMKDQATQNPMSANRSSWTKGKEAAAFFGPKKRVNKKKKLNKRRVTVKGPVSSCALDDKEDPILEDDEIFKALAAHETKFEYGPQSADARSKVKIICNRFESICRAIVHAAGHRSVKVRRIDLAADKLIRKLPGFTKQGPVVGSVPGVEVGDEFLYRVQLALVGLHRPYQGGIDATRHDETGVRIAISVVASGGYPDELSSCSGDLVYTGSGKKDYGDQKLEHGNLALKNCIEMKTPVRVIHGFRDQNREEGSHSRAREISRFTYDGLYHVVDCWREGSPGSKVFKYKLQRIPGH